MGLLVKAISAQDCIKGILGFIKIAFFELTNTNSVVVACGTAAIKDYAVGPVAIISGYVVISVS